MVKLIINLGERSYPIYVTNDYSGFGKSLAAAKITGKLVLVTDSNVDRHQAADCLSALAGAGYEVSKYVLEAGEKSKNLETVKDIYKYLLNLKLDRNSAIIALGGGVVGDVAGFVAATYLRGIHFIQVPTSLLAQADSSVGGKVGVDFEGSKNIIGAFYQPKLVYINVASLKTLPERELRSGLAEVIKHGIIADEDFFEYVDYNMRKIFTFDDEVLQYIARTNCSIKGKVVEADERESGLRAILNFGHTIGHAVESVSNFKYSHGECVSVGMAGAFRIARQLEMVDDKLVEKVENTLMKAGLPVKMPGMDIDEVYRQMFHDKKIRNNKLLFILPKRIGEVIQLTIEDEGLLKGVLREILS